MSRSRHGHGRLITAMKKDTIQHGIKNVQIARHEYGTEFFSQRSPTRQGTNSKMFKSHSNHTARSVPDPECPRHGTARSVHDTARHGTGKSAKRMARKRNGTQKNGWKRAKKNGHGHGQKKRKTRYDKHTTRKKKDDTNTARHALHFVSVFSHRAFCARNGPALRTPSTQV